jgi:hypothetical protein
MSNDNMPSNYNYNKNKTINRDELGKNFSGALYILKEGNSYGMFIDSKLFLSQHNVDTFWDIYKKNADIGLDESIRNTRTPESVISRQIGELEDLRTEFKTLVVDNIASFAKRDFEEFESIKNNNSFELDTSNIVDVATEIKTIYDSQCGVDNTL